MKKLSRDARLGIWIVLLLAIVTVIVATQRKTDTQYPSLSTLSSAPDGALALKLWLGELHYTVDETVLAEFAPPDHATILFMLEPLFPSDSDMKAVDEWVKQGGTLILIGDGYGMFSAVDHYDFSLKYLDSGLNAVKEETPILLSPTQWKSENIKARFALETTRTDYVPLAVNNGKPVLVSFDDGKGRVILGTTTISFTNAGLKLEGNPEFVLNVLALARQRGTVWFDEWHHGGQSNTQVSGPAEFLQRNPVGRALLFTVVVMFVVLFLQGRGFGRPVPLPEDIKRRGAIEHVTGIANLSRRAAHRSGVMLHYHSQIKRKLGYRYRLDPELEDAEYVNALVAYNPSLDRNGLLNLLQRLKRRNVSETDMVQLASEAAKWIDN